MDQRSALVTSSLDEATVGNRELWELLEHLHEICVPVIYFKNNNMQQCFDPYYNPIKQSKEVVILHCKMRNRGE